MPVVRISDDAGDTMTLLDINGRFFPVLRTPGYDQVTEIRGMESWKARCNDVLVCAYPKSVDYGSWFDNALHWHEATKSLPNGSIHVMTYENLHTSTEEEIKRLAEFLGVGCNNKLSREICEMCSFSVMKQDKDPLEDASEWKHGEPGMYRKGQVGDWRNWFTVAQNEMFTAVYEQKMADSDITLEYGHDKV